MTAEQILEMIKNLDNATRWELLSLLYDEYYRKTGEPIKGIEIDY